MKILFVVAASFYCTAALLALDGGDRISEFLGRDTTTTILGIQQTDYIECIYLENDMVIIKADYKLFVAELSHTQNMYPVSPSQKDIKRKIQSLHKQHKPSINLSFMFHPVRSLPDSSTYKEKLDYEMELNKKQAMYRKTCRILAGLIDKGQASVFRKTLNSYIDTIVCRRGIIVNDPNYLSGGRSYYFLDGKCFFNVEDHIMYID